MSNSEKKHQPRTRPLTTRNRTLLMTMEKLLSLSFLLLLFTICSSRAPLSHLGLQPPLSRAAVPFLCKRRCLPRRQFYCCLAPADCVETRCRLPGKRSGLRCARLRSICLLEAWNTGDGFDFTCTCPKNVREVKIALKDVDIVCMIYCLEAARGVERACKRKKLERFVGLVRVAEKKCCESCGGREKMGTCKAI